MSQSSVKDILWSVLQGRDANRKLQRSIKAGKQRERMPSLVEQLRQVLTHWQMDHRQPFTYDGWDYKVSCPCALHAALVSRHIISKMPLGRSV